MSVAALGEPLFQANWKNCFQGSKFDLNVKFCLTQVKFCPLIMENGLLQALKRKKNFNFCLRICVKIFETVPHFLDERNSETTRPTKILHTSN